MANLKYNEAFKRPFLDIKKLLIGIILSIFPIINFFAIGYILKNAKQSFTGKFGLAEWDNWGDLFVKGLASFVISLIYFIPALLVMLIGYMMSGTLFLFTGGISTGLSALVFLLVLFIILVVLAAYLSPMAILNYIDKNNFGAAFDTETLKKTFNGLYFVAWIVGIIYMIVLNAILGMVPYIGGGIALFVTGMTSYTLLGNAFGMLKGKRTVTRKKTTKKRKKTRRKR
jgi:hypothetical protein